MSCSDEDDALFARIGPAPQSHALMLQQAAGIAKLGYFVFNLRDNIVELCSTRHAAIFGQTPAEFIATVTGLAGEMAKIHPDDRDMIRAAYSRLQRGETIQLDYRFFRPDGAMGSVREVVAPDRDPTGAIVRGLGSSLDMTRAQQEAQAQAQASRLEALGELTAGVAHDFNNLLAVVMGNTDLLRGMGPTVEMDALLAEIVDASERGSRLTQSLLNFAQKAAVRPTRFDLRSDVLSTADLLRPTLLQKTAVTAELGDRQLRVHADRDMLQSVLVNLMINARDALEDGSRITISAAVRTVEGGPGRSGPHRLPPGPYVRLAVRDTGVGIAPDILERVTEPFFTTKSRARGSGLGLSMAMGFMRQLGGDLVIHSEPGKGTEVALFFPEIASEDEAWPMRDASPSLPSGAAR